VSGAGACGNGSSAVTVARAICTNGWPRGNVPKVVRCSSGRFRAALVSRQLRRARRGQL